MEEDPTLKMHRDAQTKEIILSGVGQLHIEVAVEKLKRKFGVEVELKAPKVPYKETIKGTRQGAGPAEEADRRPRPVRRRLARGVEPLPRGTGFEFVDDIVGGVIPRQFIPAVEKGVREALHEGILAGYEIVDVRVTLYDGSYHERRLLGNGVQDRRVDGLQDRAGARPSRSCSSRSWRWRSRCRTTAWATSSATSTAAAARCSASIPKVGAQVIRALVPMAEVLRYSPDLRSMTSGRGAFTMEFDHYEELPAAPGREGDQGGRGAQGARSSTE